MAEIGFYIQALAGWTQGKPTPQVAVPPLLQRRITPVGRVALSLAWKLPHIERARYIYSSRHGELERTLSLLLSVVRHEDLSPADFTLSVHHALIGLLSIAQKNKRGHTAIAAGADSFCFGLIEAAACLAEQPDEPVVFIHCDDFLPPTYDMFKASDDCPAAVAMTLTAKSQLDIVRLTQAWAEQGIEQPGNHAAAFLNFMAGHDVSYTSHGNERCWHWTRHVQA